MSDNQTFDAASQASEVDSLCANEFAVELEGVPVTGVFRISGLTTFKLRDIQTGATNRVPFVLSKMVQRDPENPFNVWIRETLQARETATRPTRTLSVVAIDDGVETRRWTIQEAYIVEIRYSDFDSASSELVEEIVSIHYANIDETWSLAQ